MGRGKIVSLEDRVPMLKQQRRKKANRRLILLLVLFFSLIACVAYFQSPLSKVKQITVIGNNHYSSEQISRHSGISLNTNIWKLKKDHVVDSIKELPEIKNVTVTIIFPNKVQIKIEEFRRVAYMMKETSFYPILENGKLVKNGKLANLPFDAPVLKNFSEGKVLEEMIRSLSELPPEVVNSISEIHHTPKDTDSYHITLFTNEGFEITATLRTFSGKMRHYPAIISQLDSKIKGIIDMEVGSYFKAYEAEEEENQDESER
ncbi:cell division protein FtsQ/DivIB [Pseudoneobacillus sp. C159]